jgi:type 1 fimbria pilin
MKLVGLCTIAVVLGSMTSLAQASGHKVSQPAVAGVIPGSTSCPVDIRAQRALSGQLQQVPAQDHQNSGPSQNIHLTLNNSSYSEIVGVRVTAYGLNAKGQITPAETASSNSSAMQKSFDLNFKVNPKSIGSVELALTGFTAVTFLNVDSIRYAGGSTWQPTAQHTCHVVPEALMMIGSR